MQNPHLDNPQFQELLVTLLLTDEQFLRKFGLLFTPDTFKPKTGEPKDRDRWIIATKALEHWNEKRTPLGKEVGGVLQQHAKDSRLNPRRATALLEYGEYLRRYRIKGVVSIEEKVKAFHEQAVFAKVVGELVELQSTGQLTVDEFAKRNGEIAKIRDNRMQASDYLAEAEERLHRRNMGRDKQRFPALLLPPIDQLVRAIAKGHLGVVIAPYKRGKSLMLLWIALAYAMQRLNVLFITLEDPKEDLEDRADACASNIALKELHNYPNRFRHNFRRFAALLRGRIRIVDGTDEKLSVADIESIWLQLREEGFTADCIIVDYDDEIKASLKNQERRFELAEIYRDLRRLAAKHNLLLWTAAQTKRNTEDIKALSADDLAEDISKVRKVAFALTLGKGEWDNSIFLFIAANKYDRQRVGAHIVPDYERMMIYDDSATMKAMRKHGVKFGEDQAKVQRKQPNTPANGKPPFKGGKRK